MLFNSFSYHRCPRHKAMMDRVEKYKPNLSLILPRKQEESRRYIWTNSQVTERITHPGRSSHSPTWAHVQRNTATFTATPSLPSLCASRWACSKQVSEPDQNIQLKSFPRLHERDSFQQVLLPPTDRKGQVTRSLEVQTNPRNAKVSAKLLETPRNP